MGARRALYATTDLPVGHFITEADVVALRPYLREGFSPAERNEVVGRYTQRPVAAGAAVLRDDIS
jgi:sialic acid synthase SpsE